jgi:ubiquitin carboxyl-terminal hydrolase 34
MSAPDQHIEQPHATHVSASPSPPRRNLGDADTFTRKRQRLDDGDAVMRAMSTDSDSPSRVITSPHKEMVAMTIQSQGTASPSPAADVDTPSPSPAVGVHHGHIATETSTVQRPKSTTLPAMLDGASDDCTSPPVIEIIDDDENDDNSAAGFTVHFDAEEYFSEFPYYERFRTASRTLHAITEHVQNSEQEPC